jgi:hypothetical protein
MSARHANAPQAADEAARQAALDAYAILDSAPEQAFDDIVRLAQMLCEVPAASISLIDRDRVWFKAQVGVDQSQVPRDQSLCNHAIVSPWRTLVVDDLAIDPIPAARRRRLDGKPPRFYAGVPLLGPEGHALGTLSVADVVPRHLTSAQVEGLELLARQTQHLLELRRFMLEQRQLLSTREAAAQDAEHARADLQRRHEALKESASRDPLTGLFNRVAMERMVAEALSAIHPNARRTACCCSTSIISSRSTIATDTSRAMTRCVRSPRPSPPRSARTTSRCAMAARRSWSTWRVRPWPTPRKSPSASVNASRGHHCRSR